MRLVTCLLKRAILRATAGFIVLLPSTWRSWPTRARGCDSPPMPGDPYSAAQEAASAIVERLGEHRAALVLGSGWADVVPMLGDPRAAVGMTELPGFPAPAVP